MIALSKDMETGVDKIDTQHRELVDRINDVLAMGEKSISKEVTKKTLDMLGDYIVKHFNDEEALQKQSGYPKYDLHREQHQFYFNEFQKLKNEFIENGHSMKFTLDLNNSIIGWIVKHIRSVDLEFGKYYNSNK